MVPKWQRIPIRQVPESQDRGDAQLMGLSVDLFSGYLSTRMFVKTLIEWNNSSQQFVSCFVVEHKVLFRP